MALLRALSGREPDGKMSVEGAAEYLWSLFVGQMR
jgi:hypothetical protein